MSIGRNLRECRAAARLSQEQAAEKLGVTRQTISGYEIGRTQPDIDTLTRLAALYGVTPERIIYGDPEPDRRRGWRRLLAAAAVLHLILLLAVSVRLALTGEYTWVKVWQEGRTTITRDYLWLLFSQSLSLPLMALTVWDLLIRDRVNWKRRLVRGTGICLVLMLGALAPWLLNREPGIGLYLHWFRRATLPITARWLCIDLLCHGIRAWLVKREKNRPSV